MTKSIPVFAAVLLVAALIPQEAAAKVDLSLGIRAGVSSSNVKWSDDDGLEKSLVKPVFAAFAEFKLSPVFSIQPEIGFVSMGEWWLDTDLDGEWKVVETFNYLQIPVLFKARLVREGKIVPNVFAGPVVSILLSAWERDYLDGVLEDEFDFKSLGLLKSTDFGAAFGAGAEFMMNKIKLIVDVRYYLGLANAADIPDFTMKNAGLMFTGGIGF